MDERDHDALIRQAAEEFAVGGPKEDVLTKLGEAKRILIEKASVMSRANALIDTLADNVDPGTRWDFARQEWAIQQIPGANQQVVDRPSRVLEIVAAKVAAGEQTINTKQVAEQLRLEGDEKPLSSLATAVGNVLSRTEKWQRIRRNVYVPFGEV